MAKGDSKPRQYPVSVVYVQAVMVGVDKEGYVG